MPKKPEFATVYPPMTRADAIEAVAELIAQGAMRLVSKDNFTESFEPTVNNFSVTQETSVKLCIIESLLTRADQKSLFEDEAP